MPGLNEILNTIQRTNDEKAEEIIRAAEKDGREIVSKEQRSAEAQAQALVKRRKRDLNGNMIRRSHPFIRRKTGRCFRQRSTP